MGFEPHAAAVGALCWTPSGGLSLRLVVGEAFLPQQLAQPGNEGGNDKGRAPWCVLFLIIATYFKELTICNLSKFYLSLCCCSANYINLNFSDELRNHCGTCIFVGIVFDRPDL